MSPLPAEMRCLTVDKQQDTSFGQVLGTRATSELPEGDVVVRVEYSSLNYKDALASTGHPGVVKNFPHVPGIDAAGTVVESQSDRWRVGDAVVVTGFGLGSARWGGYAEYIRVPADWVVALPAGLTARESMIAGTAGYTAAQSVAAIVAHGVEPSSGEVSVTGASGGVGCWSVAILARLGYTVVAVSGKPEAKEFLEKLGASAIIGRQDVDDRSPRPLLSGRWAGAIDSVGGNTLATILRATKNGGCVTACGLVGGIDLPLTVHPFILRGVSLIGIDSSGGSMAQRLELWKNLAGPWKPADCESLTTEISLDEVPRYVQQILAGRTVGRVVVRVAG